MDRDRLPVAMTAVFSLPLHCRVPPAVQVEYVRGFLEIEADTAGPQRNNQDLVLLIGPEPAY